MYIHSLLLCFAEQPKIGVYMLNSGSKKLLIKVSVYLSFPFSWNLIIYRFDIDKMIYIHRICRCSQKLRWALNFIRFCWNQRQKTSPKWLHLPAEVKTHFQIITFQLIQLPRWSAMGWLLFLVVGPLLGHERKCISHVSLKMLGTQTAHSFPGIHIAER